MDEAVCQKRDLLRFAHGTGGDHVVAETLTRHVLPNLAVELVAYEDELPFAAAGLP